MYLGTEFLITGSSCCYVTERMYFYNFYMKKMHANLQWTSGHHKSSPYTHAFYPLQLDGTPLHYAARGGHTTCVERLLSTPGIDVNIRNDVSFCTECFCI